MLKLSFSIILVIYRPYINFFRCSTWSDNKLEDANKRKLNTNQRGWKTNLEISSNLVVWSLGRSQDPKFEAISKGNDLNYSRTPRIYTPLKLKKSSFVWTIASVRILATKFHVIFLCFVDCSLWLGVARWNGDLHSGFSSDKTRQFWGRDRSSWRSSIFVLLFFNSSNFRPLLGHVLYLLIFIIKWPFVELI